MRNAAAETVAALAFQLPPWRGCSVQAWCWQAVQRPEDRRRHTETKRERFSVCGQGSWCNWCNGCLSFLLGCHSLMTRPSSSGSLWQNTGTRSAGRRLSDSAAVADAFLPPARPSHYPPFLSAFLSCLFVWHLFVPRVYLVPSIIGVGPFIMGQHSLFICPPLLASSWQEGHFSTSGD